MGACFCTGACKEPPYVCPANRSTETPEERARRIGVPLIPKREKEPFSPNRTVAVCGECGRDVHALEYYSCGHNNCPVQSKPHFICGGVP